MKCLEMALVSVTTANSSKHILLRTLSRSHAFSFSLRPTYLYFIFNVLIIALGTEAALLTDFAKPFCHTETYNSPRTV